MTTPSIWALEDLRNLFSEKYQFTILVRFFEQTRDGYIARKVQRKVIASSMNEACTTVLGQFSEKSDVRIGGITLPKTMKLGSKRPVNPFMSKRQMEAQRTSNNLKSLA